MAPTSWDVMEDVDPFTTSVLIVTLKFAVLPLLFAFVMRCPPPAVFNEHGHAIVFRTSLFKDFTAGLSGVMEYISAHPDRSRPSR